MKKIVIIFILILSFPLSIMASDVTMDWIQSLNKENTYIDYEKVREINSNELIVIGNMEGDTSKAEDSIILKYNTDGELLWEKVYSGNDDDVFLDFVVLSDGSFIVVGYSSSKDIDGLINNGKEDAIIIKYNKDGEILWQKNWGGIDDDSFNSIQYLGNDEFIIVGSSSSTDLIFENNATVNGEDGIIVKCNIDGTILWQKNWGENGKETFSNVRIGSDGFYVEGSLSTTNALNNSKIKNGIIIKYGFNGMLLWQKKLTSNFSSSFYDIHVTSNDEIILLGSIENESMEDVGLIIKYDSNGDVIWEKELGVQNLFRGIATISESIYIVGKNSNSDATLIKLDNNGNIIWEDACGSSENESLNNIYFSADGMSFYLLGYKNVRETVYVGKSVGLLVKYVFKYNFDNIETKKGEFTTFQKGSLGIINPIPEKGYEVDKIIIKDKEGNILDVEVTKLEDGTYSFELYTDVSVEVLFKEKIENPKTGVFDYIMISPLIGIFVLALFILYKNNSKGYQL